MFCIQHILLKCLNIDDIQYLINCLNIEDIQHVFIKCLNIEDGRYATDLFFCEDVSESNHYHLTLPVHHTGTETGIIFFALTS